MAGILVITIVGIVLAWAGVTTGVDSIVHYVFAIVDQIPATPWDLLKPVYNPEPMYTHAYRPLSTALVKLGGAIFGRSESGLQMMAFVHGLFLVPYGISARYCLMVHGLKPGLSTAAALTSMLTPTVLFSAWTIPEFDMVGGIFVLLAAAMLHRGRFKLFVPLALLALLTKETSAILLFAYLCANALLKFRTDKKSLWVAGGYLFVLFLAVLPILMLRPEVTTEYNVASAEFNWFRIPYLAFHNLSQVFYLVGPSGAALLLWSHWPSKWLRVMIFVALLPFLMTPLLRHYNHYESVIFSNWLWVLLWSGVGVFGLIRVSLESGSQLRVLSLTAILAFGGLLAGPLLASFARADLSARLYSPVLPLIHGLVWTGALVAWKSGRWGRIAGGVATLAFVWLPAAGAFNAWQFAQARFPVELGAKKDLIARLAPPCPWVFYPNRDQELAQEEFNAIAAVPKEVAECTKLVQLAVTETGPGRIWDYPKRLDGYDQYRESVDTVAIEDALRRREKLPHPVHLYVQGARSTMDKSSNTALNVDFEWATRRMPETDIGYFQQTMGLIYAKDTPLERLFESAAPMKKKRRSAFVQLPIWLHELPKRLILSVAVLESYRYQGDVYSIPHAKKPSGVPDQPGPPRRQ